MADTAISFVIIIICGGALVSALGLVIGDTAARVERNPAIIGNFFRPHFYLLGGTAVIVALIGLIAFLTGRWAEYVQSLDLAVRALAYIFGINS